MTQVNDAGLEAHLQTFTLGDALESVGSKNSYQWKLLAIMCLTLMVQAAHLSGQSYSFSNAQLICGQDACDQSNQDFCDTTETITVDPNYKYYTLVTQFSLWCGNKYLLTISESSYFIGSILGGFYMSYLADIYGRRIIYIISFGITTLGIIGITTSISIYQYCVFNLIMGFGALPTYILNYVILNESSGTRFRQTSSIILLVFFINALYGMSETLTAYLFYYFTNWRNIYIFYLAIPAMISFILTFYILETPQFYYQKKNTEKLFSTLDLISKINKKQRFSELLLVVQDRLDPEFFQNSDEDQIDKKKYGFSDLFSYKSLRYSSIGFIQISFTLHLLYYGGQYSISSIAKGDFVYVLGGLIGIVETLTYLIIKQFIHILPRKKTLFISYFICIISCSGFLFFGISASSTQTDCEFCTKQILVITLACLIRIFNALGFGLQGLYANEVFPTCVRSLGTGVLFAVGVIGSFISPYTIALGDHLNINPYLIIGLVSLFGLSGTSLLKETLGKKLPDEISEEKLIKDDSKSQGTNIYRDSKQSSYI